MNILSIAFLIIPGVFVSSSSFNSPGLYRYSAMFNYRPTKCLRLLAAELPALRMHVCYKQTHRLTPGSIVVVVVALVRDSLSCWNRRRKCKGWSSFAEIHYFAAYTNMRTPQTVIISYLYLLIYE